MKKRLITYWFLAIATCFSLAWQRYDPASLPLSLPVAASLSVHRTFSKCDLCAFARNSLVILRNRAHLQSFHASVFQAAIDSHVNVNPVLIQYLDPSGAVTQLAAYVDDMSLLTSLDHIICSPGLRVRLVVFDSLDFQNQSRQQLAERCRDLIQSELIQ